MHWIVLHHLLRPIKWLYKKLTVKDKWPELPPPAPAAVHEPTVIVNVTETVGPKWEPTKFSTGEVPLVQVIPQVTVKTKKTLKKPLKKPFKPRAKLKPEQYKLPAKSKKKK